MKSANWESRNEPFNHLRADGLFLPRSIGGVYVMGMNNWIPVDKDMPKPLTKVVLLFETEATRFGEYVPSMERFEPLSSNEKQWKLQPTHWMSLELPEDE